MSVIGGTVRMGRRWAEARMLDSCEVGEFTEGYDPETGQPVPELVAEQYMGRCRFSSSSNAVSESDAGGQSFADQSLILSVPIAEAGLIRTDATVKCTAVDEASGNPVMVGRTFRIAGLASVSQATAARFSLELIS